eukprot:2509759-Prymnesium_polylepis.1
MFVSSIFAHIPHAPPGGRDGTVGGSGGDAGASGDEAAGGACGMIGVVKVGALKQQPAQLQPALMSWSHVKIAAASAQVPFHPHGRARHAVRASTCACEAAAKTGVWESIVAQINMSSHPLKLLKSTCPSSGRAHAPILS